MILVRRYLSAVNANLGKREFNNKKSCFLLIYSGLNKYIVTYTIKFHSTLNYSGTDTRSFIVQPLFELFRTARIVLNVADGTDGVLKTGLDLGHILRVGLTLFFPF